MNHNAIYKLNPSVVTIRGDKAYDANDNEVIYDKSAVNAWIDPEAYKYQRAAEYPSFADQFDTLYHGGYDAWKATIDSVKAKYPKP
jgi:hypothetical protein